MLLMVYRGAIVGGRRQAEYLRFLGFRRRPVLPGYNSVGLERVREQGLAMGGKADVAFEDRHFIFVGRFVRKKHLATLLEGYAAYVAQAGRAHVGSNWRAAASCSQLSRHMRPSWALPILSISGLFDRR
jgi:glycosyltransferase involved in cell wall biosynthesis